MLAAVGRELLWQGGLLTGLASSRAAAAVAAALGPNAAQSFISSQRAPPSPADLANEASTSYSTSWPLLSPAFRPAAHFTQRRSYQKHYINRPNLAQPIDVNTLDALLKQTTTPGGAALHVLKYSAYLNPRQTAHMLQKLPRLEQLYRLRYGRAWDEEQYEAYRVLMYCLQQRLVDVLEDCTPGQLEQGLWGLTTARLRSARMSAHLQPGTPGLASRLDRWLTANAPLAAAQPRVLSHAAWFLSASGAGGHAAMDRVVALLAPPADAAAPMDHRSLCRLAWAFSRAGRGAGRSPGQAAAWSRVCGEAATAMEALVKGSRKGKPLPRRTYLYRTVAGPRVLPGPRPYRPSKYLRFDGARVATASFDLPTAASLLASMAAAGVRDAPCLRAISRLVAAALPLERAPQRGGASELELRAAALLPGTPGGLIPGPSRTQLPAQAASLGLLGGMGVLGMRPGAAAAAGAAGGGANEAARLKIGAAPDAQAQGLGKEAAGQLLRGFYSLRFRSPAVAAAVVRHTRFSQFEDAAAGQLAALAHMASVLGLGSGGGSGRGGVPQRQLVERLQAAALPLLPAMSAEERGVLAAALARAGLDAALAQLDAGGRVLGAGAADPEGMP